MKPMEALAVWANACDHTGIQWFLYRETLLCANGYHSFPQELTCAQIAICDKDLSPLMESVFPVLPSHWQQTVTVPPSAAETSVCSLSAFMPSFLRAR